MPIRSNTIDAMDAAQAAQARVRDALESELVYLYEQQDAMRKEIERLRLLEKQTIRRPEVGWWEAGR